MRRRILRSLAVTAILVGLALPVSAGWVEVDSHSGTTYISDGKVKNVDEAGGMWSVFDAKKGTLIMVDPKKRTYTEVDPVKFCKQISSAMDAMMEGIPPEQRAMMEQMMGKGGAKRAPKVSVTKKGSGGKIAGYSTVKYTVTVDGRPYKDIWLATSAPIMKDVEKYMKMMTEMSVKMDSCAGGEGPGPESSKEYLSLTERGWTMKEVNKQSGEVESEVRSLTMKSIPASEFRVPSGYRKTDTQHMMEGMMQ